MSKLKDAWVSVILILARSVASTDTEVSCPEVKVEREILKSGFHRDLVTRVSIQGFTDDGDDCRILLNETIPSGLYMDQYELATLQKHNLAKVILPTFVDVEAPEYLSKAFSALVYMKLDNACDQCYISTVPVHARYHRPSAEVYEVSVQVPKPELLIHCRKDVSLKGCSSQPLVKASCGSSNEEECHWLKFPYTLVKDNTVLLVPVGITQHGPAVLIVTVAVTLICCGMLVMSMYWHKQKSS